jgi:hypothetical protein
MRDVFAYLRQRPLHEPLLEAQILRRKTHLRGPHEALARKSHVSAAAAGVFGLPCACQVDVGTREPYALQEYLVAVGTYLRFRSIERLLGVFDTSLAVELIEGLTDECAKFVRVERTKRGFHFDARLVFLPRKPPHHLRRGPSIATTARAAMPPSHRGAA